jgi:hypothetical protein
MAECGAEVGVDAAARPGYRTGMSMIPVLTTANLGSIALARSILAAADVTFVLENEHANLVPRVDDGVRVLVPVDELDFARILLRRANLVA